MEEKNRSNLCSDWGKLSDKLALTVPEMAEVLSIGRNTAYRLIHVKGFPVIWIGNRAIIPTQELCKWLEKNSTTIVDS